MSFREGNQATADPITPRRGPVFNRSGGVVPLGVAMPSDPWMNIADAGSVPGASGPGVDAAGEPDPAVTAAAISPADFRCDGAWVEHTAFPRVRVRYAPIMPDAPDSGHYAARIHWLDEPVTLGTGGAALPRALVARISELAWQAFQRARAQASPTSH